MVEPDASRIRLTFCPITEQISAARIVPLHWQALVVGFLGAF